MSETHRLSFSIEGSFITALAREKLFMDKNLNRAVELLKSATVCDELTNDEHLMLCLKILNGDAEIIGRSGTESYDVVIHDDTDKDSSGLENIATLIEDLNEKCNSLEQEYHEMMQKFCFICEQMSDFEIEQINADYYNEFGEAMFKDLDIPDWRKIENQYTGMDAELQSFLDQRIREQKAMDAGKEICDYGWIDPDGEFYPVEWGNHSSWAREWLDEHKPFKDYPSLYWMTDSEGRRHSICCGDVLVHSLGWVLLDNPHQGLAKMTSSPRKPLTKAQKETLYQYFIDRGRTEEANALYQDE